VTDEWRCRLLLQARIAELEDELEQERAGRVKVTSFQLNEPFSVSDISVMPITCWRQFHRYEMMVPRTDSCALANQSGEGKIGLYLLLTLDSGFLIS